MHEQAIEEFILRYVKKRQVVSIGTSDLGQAFLKKLALANEERELSVKFIPTSAKIASLAATLGLEIVSLNDYEIDVGFEFVSAVDHDYNFVKRETHSLIRDKMVAESASDLVVVCHEHGLEEKLGGWIPFEVEAFGARRTVANLGKIGDTKMRMEGANPFKTETGNYLVDVKVDEVFDYDDLEFQTKAIPGVLEIGLFVGFADRVVLHNGHVVVKDRTRFEEEIEAFS